MRYPLYLLRRGKGWQVVFPEDKADIGHADFWENTVSVLVGARCNIPQVELANLPYCQRRARIVGDVVYYGGRPEPDLLEAIRKATGNAKLAFCYDEHERRLKEDVLELRKLVRRYSGNDRRRPGKRR
jgi:hypothetical protein